MGESVSFGKYENDEAAATLCWEKWSTFSSPNNKYLEEVGKCSTPGSVAQKKAFFEAHYKKLAAIKAEAELLLDQQKDSESLDDQQQPVAAVEDEPVQAPKTILDSNADKLQEAVLVNVESMNLVKQHFQVDLQTQEEDPPQVRQPIPQNVTTKVTPNKVEKNPIGMKKKPASLRLQTFGPPLLLKMSADVVRRLQTFSYRKNKQHLIPRSPVTPAASSTLPKPKPKPKPKPTSASTLKKASAPSSSSVSSSKNKNHSLSESRRVTPVSHHLSMSMSSVNSDTAASSVTSSRRRSLFMEQMGDKDIVKRAFKTFQNRVNQLPSSDSGTKPLPTKRSEQKTVTSTAYQKENQKSRKAPAAAVAEKIKPARGQLGPKWKSVSYGSLKGVGVDERRLKAGPATVALKSDERAERRKEFLKKLEEKSNARRSKVSLKSKDVKDDEMKKVRQKAKAMPKAPGVLKST